MALSKIVKINEKVSWALWKIDVDWQVMLREQSFTPNVLQDMDRISHPQKKAEFLASRLALYVLLDAAGIDQREIVKDSHGKPFIKDTDIHISIANSYPYAVAILDHGKPTGIDIEAPSDKLIRVQHKFLHEQELDYFKDQREKLCLAWCAKECLYKLYGRKNLSLKQHIRIEKVYYPEYPSLKCGIYCQDYTALHHLYLEQADNFFIIFSV